MIAHADKRVEVCRSHRRCVGRRFDMADAPPWSFYSLCCGGKLELRMKPHKCLYLYHYYKRPVFGFMHIRVQTWLRHLG